MAYDSVTVLDMNNKQVAKCGLIRGKQSLEDKENEDDFAPEDNFKVNLLMKDSGCVFTEGKKKKVKELERRTGREIGKERRERKGEGVCVCVFISGRYVLVWTDILWYMERRDGQRNGLRTCNLHGIIPLTA